MKTFLVILIALVAIPAIGADSGPIVAVTGGQIRGAMLDKGGAVFKGIPYAQPPVGDLRWREPMPVKPWAGGREATAFGAICAQPPNGMAGKLLETSNEDCLFINVWTPEWPSSSRKAVLVWIPGGGNIIGGSSVRLYEGAESLARRGVVLVMLNYRLGFFGFFSHPELTRESTHRASGNQGILDQVAALKWVHDNITRFGGDPRNVTISGDSAGSTDVSMLMTSPLSKGLFQKAIAQSGPFMFVGVSDLLLPEAEKRGENAVLKWNLSPRASAKELRAVPSAEILKTPRQPAFLTVDGYVFARHPVEAFATGREHAVALLVGTNSRERIPIPRPPTDLAKAIRELYGPLAERAQALYTGAADSIYGTPTDQWDTDTVFRCSAMAQMVWHAAAGHPGFQYEFARVPPGLEVFGATHGSEIPYVFGGLNSGIQGAVGPRVRATSADMQTSDAMQQYWTNFAKTGNPNGGNLPKWPKFDVSTRAYLQFTDAGPVAKEGLRRPFCDLFIENVKRLMTK